MEIEKRVDKVLRNSSSDLGFKLDGAVCRALTRNILIEVKNIIKESNNRIVGLVREVYEKESTNTKKP